MSGFVDPDTGKRYELFSAGGGRRLAAELGVAFLGEVPVQPGLAEQADRGLPVVVAAPTSPAGLALGAIAAEVIKQAGVRRITLPVIEG